MTDDSCTLISSSIAYKLHAVHGSVFLIKTKDNRDTSLGKTILLTFIRKTKFSEIAKEKKETKKRR